MVTEPAEKCGAEEADTVVVTGGVSLAPGPAVSSVMPPVVVLAMASLCLSWNIPLGGLLLFFLCRGYQWCLAA